jgi:hypothetical protein
MVRNGGIMVLRWGVGVGRPCQALVTVGLALPPPYDPAPGLHTSPAVHSTFQIWIRTRFSNFLAGRSVFNSTGTWRVGFPHLSNPLTFSSDLGFAWLKGAGWGIRTCWFDVDRQTSQTFTGTLTFWGVPLVSCWLLAQETKWLLTHPGHPPPLLTHHITPV